MAKILIIGASGLLGQHLLIQARDRGLDATGTCSRDQPLPGLTPLDLSDTDAIHRLLGHEQPKMVLLAAAMTSVDGCERNPRLAEQINAAAPKAVAENAPRAARLVYYSTDYVFNGTSGSVAEHESPNPLGVYGRTKLSGERNVLSSHPDALVIRTCANFGWNRLRARENSVTWILGKLRRGETVPLFTDQWMSPSYAVDVAGITFGLLDLDARGIYHVASRSCLSRLDAGHVVCEVFRLPKDLLEPTKMTQAGLLAQRPVRSCLAVDKVERTFDMQMGSFRDCLVRMRDSE